MSTVGHHQLLGGTPEDDWQAQPFTVENSLDVMVGLLDESLSTLESIRLTYDAKQIGAGLIFRACCARWVYATKPDAPCARCGR